MDYGQHSGFAWPRLTPGVKLLMIINGAVFVANALLVDALNQLLQVSGHGLWEGYGLGLVMGAKLAEPERPVVVLVGDHGLLYTAQELATAVEQRLPIVIILWNNNRLGQIRDDMVEKGIPPVGVELHSPDFCALARAYGCRASRPESLEAFSEDVAGALAQSDGPWLIELREEIPGMP